MSTMTRRRPATDEERLYAAERRAAHAATAGYRTQRDAARGGVGVPEGPARSLGFGAALRAKKVTYNDQQLVHLRGIASVFDTKYEMWDMWGPYDEIVDGHAADKTLAADPDVAFLVNHRGVTMARTVAMPGKQPTLLLGVDDVPGMDVTGLASDAYLNPKRQDVADLVIAVEDGQVTEMSFAFMIEEGWWSDDFMTFKIAEFDIHRGDVSAVNYGANPYTSIAARQREILADVAAMPAGAARAVLRELMGRTDISVDTLYSAFWAGVDEDRARAAKERASAEDAAPAAAEDVPGSTRGPGRSLTHIAALLADDDED